MKEDIFRKKSLSRVNSPESLHDYIRVCNPGVWILLIAIIVLLLGVCVWGIFGRIETTVSVNVFCENGVASAVTLDGKACDKIEAGQTIKIGDAQGVVADADFSDGKYDLSISVPDGAYSGEIVTESIKPFSFIYN